MTHKYLQANGIQLAYDEFGNSTDPAIVLIMGLGTQMIAWPEIMCEGLAAQGFRVIRFDNRDIGLSEKIDDAQRPNLLLMAVKSRLGLPLRVSYTLKDMADDAIGLMDALDIDRAHLVGASMGGMIGQLVTAHAGDRVHSFTSIMSSSGARHLPAARFEITKAMIQARPKTEEAMIQQRINLFRMIGSVGELAPNEQDMRDKVTASYQRNYHPAGYVRHMAAVMHNGSRVNLLKKITSPTLVIHGKADPLVPVEAGIDTARHIAGAKLELIENMGHDLPKQLLPRFVELISTHASEATR